MDPTLFFSGNHWPFSSHLRMMMLIKGERFRKEKKLIFFFISFISFLLYQVTIILCKRYKTCICSSSCLQHWFFKEFCHLSKCLNLLIYLSCLHQNTNFHTTERKYKPPWYIHKCTPCIIAKSRIKINGLDCHCKYYTSYYTHCQMKLLQNITLLCKKTLCNFNIPQWF